MPILITLDAARNFVLLAAVSVAVWTDFKKGLIPNWLTAPLFVSGLTYSVLRRGFMGLPEALVTGLLVLFFTFCFCHNGFGGGDLKLSLGIGAWLGMEGWTWYFVGMGLSHLLLGLLVRFKIYGPGLKSVAAGIYAELVTWQLPELGEKNFRLLQRPREMLTGDKNTPAVPGVLWVAGGVLAAVLAAHI